MEIKEYVRRGTIGEAMSYSELITYDTQSPENVLVVMEGKGRRKIRLTPKRVLYETYFPGSFIGLEDLLLDKSRKGAAGVFPGSHYVIWNSEDFLNSLKVNPDIVWQTIDCLSRRIRIYDQKQKHTSMELKDSHSFIDHDDPNSIPGSLADSLYRLTFSSDDEFPSDIVEQLSIPFKKGEYVLKQGDKSREIYIVLSGQAKVIQHNNGNSEEIDIIESGDFIGEMSMFDGLPRSADIVADNDLLLLKFEPQNFHLIFQLHSRWSMKILKTLAERVEQRRKELEQTPLDSLYKL